MTDRVAVSHPPGGGEGGRWGGLGVPYVDNYQGDKIAPPVGLINIYRALVNACSPDG